MMKLVTRPPIMGATTRFIMSAPVPSDHMIGIKPIIAALTVIIFGRARSRRAMATLVSCFNPRARPSLEC
jgi:hypothetical protein